MRDKFELVGARFVYISVNSLWFTAWLGWSPLSGGGALCLRVRCADVRLPSRVLRGVRDEPQSSAPRSCCAHHSHPSAFVLERRSTRGWAWCVPILTRSSREGKSARPFSILCFAACAASRGAAWRLLPRSGPCSVSLLLPRRLHADTDAILKAARKVVGGKVVPPSLRQWHVEMSEFARLQQQFGPLKKLRGKKAAAGAAGSPVKR